MERMRVNVRVAALGVITVALLFVGSVTLREERAAAGVTDFTGVYDVLATVAPSSGTTPGIYFHCLSRVDHNTVTNAINSSSHKTTATRLSLGDRLLNCPNFCGCSRRSRQGWQQREWLRPSWSHWKER